ncbi:response regulator [Paenibacillus monticola]|uniref:Circadian input-output histidine kinase CikA n=1 Tax=Paenibacillus monticola TaxID=2666075 RepID=A0A7X2L480_9BACL|nr:response regulator [Paenibacillus monticola]MRN55116.1 response regulator [Paenibacillus monticola]
MPRYNAWSIQTKIISGFLIIIGCLAIYTMVVHSQIYSKQNEVNVITIHDREVTSLTNQIEKSVLDMEDGVRGYVITGDLLYLEPYTRGKTQWQEYFNQLYEVIATDSFGIQRLQAVKLNIENWIAQNVDPIILLKKNNDEVGIAKSFSNGAGIQQVDQIRQQFDTFRQDENQSTDNRITAQKKSNNTLIAFLYIFALVVASIAILISIVLSRTILNTLRKATSTINGIALSNDNLEERIIVTTKDEIGDLAHATNLLLDSHQHQYWIQTQTSEFAEMYQGIEDTVELADRFLTKVSAILNGQYGAIYLFQDNKSILIKAASYAGDGSNIGKQSFRVGDGLVGQCAKEKKIIHINQIPEEYIKIESGLGESKPRHILLVPVVHQGNLQAVLEIASMEEFTVHQLRLLDNLLLPFAAAAEVVRSRMEIDRLYSESQILNNELQLHAKETQEQAEELQVQSEELRLKSEELQSINSQMQEQRNHAQAKTAEAEEARAEMQLYAEQLKVSSQYKSEFLANMSHELRTPLNSMLVFSQFLKENNNHTLTDDELLYAGYIQNSGNDLLSLINDILDLSKVESGKMEPNIDAINLSEMPQIMEQHFSELAARKGLEFAVILHPDTPNLMFTDEQRLQQILKNLISNAIKFTTIGKVEITIRKAVLSAEHLEMQIDNSNEVISFAVRDTGLGIPKDKYELIFESFQQADGTIERNYGGTGLGLSISNQLTTLLGGSLLLESELGVGSIFTLYLPSLSSDFEPFEAAPTVEILSSPVTVQQEIQELLPSEGSEVFQGKRVLIVDDDKRNAIALTVPLTQRGMKVFVADSGKACINILEQEKMDIVLMDIMMPEMNGYQVMDWIRNTLQDANLPIIAVTAKAMNQDREKSLAAGASDYLSKPIQMNQLFSLMRVWLNKS